MRFENVSVMNFENAIRGFRNPLMSHTKSDTTTGYFYHYKNNNAQPGCWIPILGEKDYGLAKTLIIGGEPHRKFLRQIFVSVDICRFSLKWLVEADTYKIGTCGDSSSTMHKITSRPLTKDDFEEGETPVSKWHIGDTIEVLNLLREQYQACKKEGDNEEAEKYFRDIKRNLPSGYLYERMTWTANYEVLANIYKWRHNHRLPEWRSFCDEFIAELPYSEFITGEFEEEKAYDDAK